MWAWLNLSRTKLCSTHFRLNILSKKNDFLMQMCLTCSANNILKKDLKCASSKRKAFRQIHTMAYLYLYSWILIQ